jgi:hypothetical protein
LVARATALLRFACPSLLDAKEMQGVPDKLGKFFSDKPGSGS